MNDNHAKVMRVSTKEGGAQVDRGWLLHREPLSACSGDCNEGRSCDCRDACQLPEPEDIGSPVPAALLVVAVFLLFAFSTIVGIGALSLYWGGA